MKKKKPPPDSEANVIYKNIKIGKTTTTVDSLSYCEADPHFTFHKLSALFPSEATKRCPDSFCRGAPGGIVRGKQNPLTLSSKSRQA